MFPDKPGGLSVYAREGWRKHFSFAGPIAVFGYWFAWSSVLAIYGSLIGYLLLAEFGGSGYLATRIYNPPIIQPLGWAQIIGVMCIVLCWIFNIRGMRPAVGLSYLVGALMIFPILVIAIGGLVDVGHRRPGLRGSVRHLLRRIDGGRTTIPLPGFALLLSSHARGDGR